MGVVVVNLLGVNIDIIENETTFYTIWWPNCLQTVNITVLRGNISQELTSFGVEINDEFAELKRLSPDQVILKLNCCQGL